jgi:hypothetical protein
LDKFPSLLGRDHMEWKSPPLYFFSQSHLGYLLLKSVQSLACKSLSISCLWIFQFTIGYSHWQKFYNLESVPKKWCLFLFNDFIFFYFFKGYLPLTKKSTLFML